MNIKEQLEQWIDRRADKIQDYDCALYCFMQASNEMKELLLIAVETLEGISKAKCSGADVYSFADDAKFDAIETLKQIQEKIKGE